MKVIISHDIDHITVWEHLFKDTILPKFIIRSHIELLSGKITFTEFYSRIGDFRRNKWNGVNEVISYNKSKHIQSTFFIGVHNGVGLSYPLAYAEPLIKLIIKNNFEIGVHGIGFDTPEKVKTEYDVFKKLSGLESFGIRMHYLRNDSNTRSYIRQAGYLYDSTETGMKDPYKKEGLWEFPLQIMDGWIINEKKRWQVRNLEQSINETKRLIEEAKTKNLCYLSILFHDRYFSGSFLTWQKWYSWLIDYLQQENTEFITYRQAVAELDNKK
jgi:hypothetical protein